MSDAKFTKGPWITLQPRGDGSVPVRTDGLGLTICYVHDGAICDAINNANLIAAAPDLYEASEPFENIAEEEDTADLREDTPVTVIIGERVHDFTLKLGDLRSIQKALRKARGETQV